MSQVIDTKVVEMQFDNSKFEKNIELSLNSLKRFVTNVDSLGKNRNSLDSLANAGDQVGIAFDNMNMKSKISLNMMDMLAGVGTKAFNRISDAVAGFAMNMANSLSGMQAMRDGFNEYELKMGSIQTILNGAKILDSNGDNITDSAQRLDIVNAELEKLNAYSDKTIYSFKDMTSNIGKFTNAGVNLEDSVRAIQGVANVAAVSGANASEASRAMYNFSQALSSGAVKLIDWKSIENANMATVDFKQQLLDTAVALGTVVKEGDLYMTTTTDAQGKTSDWFNATTKFNDALSNQWMTTEVLTQTLKNYSTDVSEMSAEQVDAYRQQLTAFGYTKEQVEGIIDLSGKAFAAATEVKTFSQMIDTLKESLGSGWAQSFEIIFGNFEEAKQLWTGLNNAIDGLLSPIGKARNEILKMWKAEGGRDAMIQSFKNLWQAVNNLLAPIKELWKALTPNTNNTGKILATIFKWIERLTSLVAKGASVIGKAIAFILKPVIFLGNFVGKQLVALVGLIRAAFAKVIEFFKPVGTAVTTFTNRLKELFTNSVVARIKNFGETISKTFADLQARVKSNSTIIRLISAFNSLKVVLQNLFGKVVKSAGKYANQFATYLGKLWNAVAPLISSTLTRVLRTLSAVILPRVEKALSWVINRLRDLARWIQKIDFKNSKLYKGLSALPNTLKSIGENKQLKAFFKSIKDFGSESVKYLSARFQGLKGDINAIKMPAGLQNVFDNVRKFIRDIFGSGSEGDKALTAMKKSDELGGFHKFLDKIADAFDWLKNAAKDAKDAVSDFIRFVIKNTPKAFNALKTFFAGEDGILTLGDIGDTFYTITAALSELMSAIGFKAFGEGIGSIGQAFSELGNSLNNFLKQAANKERFAAIKDFAIALGILSGALYILSKIPSDKLVGVVSALGIIGLGLSKFVDQISQTNYSAVKVLGNLSIAALFIGIGVGMMAIAASITMLVGALALLPSVIKQYNNLGDSFRDGMDRVTEVLTQLFEYINTSINGKYALRTAAGLYLVVASLKKIYDVIVQFGTEMDDMTMMTAMTKIGQILSMLGNFLSHITIIPNINIGIQGINLDTVGVAAMIWAIGDLLTKIVPVLQSAGKIPPNEAVAGMDVIEKLLFRLGLFIVAIEASSLVKRFGGGVKLGQWIGIALTVTMIGTAIGMIVDSIKTLTALATGDTAKGFDAAVEVIQGIFIGLGVIMAIIGSFKPAGAGVLFTLSVSIGLLCICVAALTPLAKDDPKALYEAVGAVGGLMIALGITLKLIGDAANKVSIGDIFKLFAIVLAVGLVVNQIRRLAKTGGDSDSIVSAGIAIAAAMISIAGGVKLLNGVHIAPTVILTIAALAAAIWALSKVIEAFKGSANTVATEASSMNQNIGKAGTEAVDTLEQTMDTRLKKIDLSGFVEPLMKTIGDKIGNFDLGAWMRKAIAKIKEDAKNWAQDFVDIGTNIVDGISAALENPANAERVKASMASLGKALIEGFKNFLGIASPSTVMIEQGGYVIDGLVQGLMQYPQKLAAWVSGIGQFIVNGISGFFTGAIEKGQTLVNSIGQGIQNGKNFVVQKASEIGHAAIEKVGQAQQWASEAVKSANSFGNSLKTSSNPIKKAAGSMIVGATRVVSGVGATFRSFGSGAASKFSSEIKSGSNSAKAAAKAMVSGAKAAFNRIKQSFKSFGHDAAEGFRSGINAMVSKVAQKAAEMVRKAKEAAKKEQNSSSPSKDFMEFGGWAAEGYAIGMANRKSTRLVEANAEAMVSAAKNAAMTAPFSIGSMYLDSNPAVNSLALAMAQISDVANSDINSSPMIRPVVDLSNVRSGANWINSTLGQKVGFGVTANNLTTARGVSAKMAAKKDSELLTTSIIQGLTARLDSMTTAINSQQNETIDPDRIYEAVRSGASHAEISGITLNGRELKRGLKDMGVVTR